MDHVLLDTDVVLDFFLDRAPYADHSARVLEFSERGLIKTYLTPIALSNCYYILRKAAKHEKVIHSLRMLLTIVDIISVDQKSVLKALNSRFKDLEDALQHFSAKNEKMINVILTRNIKDFKESDYAIMTPEMYLKSIANG
jgi:predicted nucleic acid-binding protein